MVAYIKDLLDIVKDFYCFMDGYLKRRPIFKMQATDPEVASGIKLIFHTDTASALAFKLVTGRNTLRDRGRARFYSVLAWLLLPGTWGKDGVTFDGEW